MAVEKPTEYQPLTDPAEVGKKLTELNTQVLVTTQELDESIKDVLASRVGRGRWKDIDELNLKTSADLTVIIGYDDGIPEAQSFDRFNQSWIYIHTPRTPDEFRIIEEPSPEGAIYQLMTGHEDEVISSGLASARLLQFLLDAHQNTFLEGPDDYHHT